MVANLILHKYQLQKLSSFMHISESSYIRVHRPLVIHDFIRFSPFFYQRIVDSFKNELYSFIERRKSNISIDNQCKEIRTESLNDIVIDRRIWRHPESLQLMRVLSGCQGLLFVKPPLKPTLPTFSPFFDLRLLYLLLFPSVDRRWCYVSDFVVNVSGACQAACTALQCCWHLWDYPPPSPLSRSHSISLKGSVHVSCYFMVTQYCPTDPGNERTTVWLADVGFFSERAHCWLEYSNTTGILIITGLGFFKITFYLTSLYDVDFFFYKLFYF